MCKNIGRHYIKKVSFFKANEKIKGRCVWVRMSVSLYKTTWTQRQTQYKIGRSFCLLNKLRPAARSTLTHTYCLIMPHSFSIAVFGLINHRCLKCCFVLPLLSSCVLINNGTTKQDIVSIFPMHACFYHLHVARLLLVLNCCSLTSMSTI